MVTSTSSGCLQKDDCRPWKIEIHAGLSEADDPPPDLVIEIAITHPSLDKLPIDAAIGVPEIWRYDEGAYVAREESVAFLRLTRQVLSRFMEESKQQERTVWLRNMRAWARQLSVSEA